MTLKKQLLTKRRQKTTIFVFYIFENTKKCKRLCMLLNKQKNGVLLFFHKRCQAAKSAKSWEESINVLNQFCTHKLTTKNATGASEKESEGEHLGHSTSGQSHSVDGTSLIGLLFCISECLWFTTGAAAAAASNSLNELALTSLDPREAWPSHWPRAQLLCTYHCPLAYRTLSQCHWLFCTAPPPPPLARDAYHTMSVRQCRQRQRGGKEKKQ